MGSAAPHLGQQWGSTWGSTWEGGDGSSAPLHWPWGVGGPPGAPIRTPSSTRGFLCSWQCSTLGRCGGTAPMHCATPQGNEGPGTPQHHQPHPGGAQGSRAWGTSMQCTPHPPAGTPPPQGPPRGPTCTDVSPQWKTHHTPPNTATPSPPPGTPTMGISPHTTPPPSPTCLSEAQHLVVLLRGVGGPGGGDATGGELRLQPTQSTEQSCPGGGVGGAGALG